MFERTLHDVVKGLRAQPTSEGRTEFASQVLQECKKEMASTDGIIKSNAVLKVAHLRMLGYDDRNFGDDDSSFHVIETMALQPFKQKRIGYLAASQMLTTDSPLLLLSTNSLKKEMQSTEMYAVGLALGSTSNFASRGLATDLLPDVISVATTALKPYVRKRGTLCLYRLCMKYPEGLRDGAYDALRSRLDDSDNAVVSCAVNAVCELARANPRNVLPLTPQLFQLLTTSGNNWLTIKVVKLYSSLLNVEPRLAKKLLDPLAHIVKTTGAKSLLYECISTVTKALRHVVITDEDKSKMEQVVHLCAVKLKEFIRDSDQNLKYLGLVGFVELTKSYPTVAQEHKDLVLLCLNDEDVTVRLRALELLAGMANKNTVSGIVSRLLEHLSKAPPGKFRDAVVQTCIDACSDDDYQRVPSCEWFVAVLMDLAMLGRGAHGPLLAKQIVNVAMRVQSVRSFAASSCARLLFETDARNEIASEVLSACAFVACEYFDLTGKDTTKAGSENTSNEGPKSQLLKLVEALLATEEDLEKALPLTAGTEGMVPSPKISKRTLNVLPYEVRCVFILNAAKLGVKGDCQDFVMQKSETWLKSGSFQVRERTRWCRAWIESGRKDFLEGPSLGPIHPAAQRKVPLPPGLDLSLRKAKQDGAASSLRNRYSSAVVSFRGQTVPKPSPTPPESTSYQTKNISSSGLESANTYSPFKLSASDPSPFLLGSAKKTKKRSGKAQQQSTKNVSDDSDQSHDEIEDEESNGVTKEHKPLWSASLSGSVHTSHMNGGAPVIVMAPSALPPGAILTDDDREEIEPRKSGAALTLADIDVTDDSPRIQVVGNTGDGNIAEPAKKEKKKKKDKDKERDEKKSKPKKSKSKPQEDTSTSAPAPPSVTEGDLLDFSEF